MSGNYDDKLPLANTTIAGIQKAPTTISIILNNQQQDTSAVKFNYSKGTLFVTELDSATKDGVWVGNMTLRLK